MRHITTSLNNRDGYKGGHIDQYPENVFCVFSNMTPRGSRVEDVEHVVTFGLQYLIKRYLIEEWNDTFFNLPFDQVFKSFKRRLDNYLGPDSISEKHEKALRALHEVGYLPLEIWALPEGSLVNIKVPTYVVWNTCPEKFDPTLFAWITNDIETISSVTTWLPTTSATTALLYRRILNYWANKTNPEMIDFVAWQGHDFAFRGHGSLESAMTSGAAHLLSFSGTDTLPAIDFLEKYYNADCEKELIGGSVAATEHSVMCAGGNTEELETFRRLIEDVYPKGIVSIVSDTWDFWNVVDPVAGLLTKLKDKILARDGKVVIRPDSGDPVKIVTGYLVSEYHGADGRFYCNNTSKELSENEIKGMVQCLYEIFGGTTTVKGFIQLDSHIGAIYGDSITIARAEEICERLAIKGFASTNIVYGIGSFTYQGAITPNAIVTRDTFGFAVKSTYAEKLVEGGVEGVEIFKAPKTDDGLKKSAKGLTAVYGSNGAFVLKDQASWDEVKNCAFVNVFSNGKIVKDWTLAEIRAKVAESF